MGYYGITGWSGGGRRPINYGLKAGQFRMTKYNIPQNTTIINNNISVGGYRGGYNYNYFDKKAVPVNIVLFYIKTNTKIVEMSAERRA